MNIKNQNINLIFHLSKRFQIHKKVFLFFFGFILFGTLSFISHHPINKNSSFDNEVVLLNDEDSEKQNDITINFLGNTIDLFFECTYTIDDEDIYKYEYDYKIDEKTLQDILLKRGGTDI